jgi:hypothetical protein
MCPSDTSVPFTFARNHATQSSLLPTRKVMDEGEKPVISCEFMDFTAYMALPQVDGASGEDHPPEMEEDWVHVGHEADVQEAGIDPEGRKETITASISASLTPGNVATTRGKRMYWPENWKPHPLANCACHTQPIPKRTRETTPRDTTPVTPTTPATPPPATCLKYLRALDSCREWSMDPEEQKRRVAFKPPALIARTNGAFRMSATSRW